MIRVSQSLISGSGSRVSITGTAPLGNPYKLGDQRPDNLKIIQDGQDISESYEHWLVWQIHLQNIVVVNALDDIAFNELDGKDTELVCTCGSQWCHGHIIKRIIEEKLNAHVTG